MLAAGARPRQPVAVRIALRDLVRYRARSGAALAATAFAVFLATAICIVASIKSENPLNWSGPNLSSSELIIYTYDQSGGMLTQLSNAQVASLTGPVQDLAASMHARSTLALNTAGACVPARPGHHQPFHRHRVRGHPAAAGPVRHQGQPDCARHRHPHRPARAGGPAPPAADLE